MLFVVLLIGLGLGLWVGAQPKSPEQRLEAPNALVAGVHVSVTVDASSLATTHAIADFGIEEGVRLVGVRILDVLQLSLRIDADEDVSMAGAARICLVGPYSAPDDAGLSDPCWGAPDLGKLVAAQMALDASEHPMFAADRPILVAATLRRGDARCDYPPGEWHVEVVLNPLVDDSPVGNIYLPDVTLDIPLEAPDAPPLIEVLDTRYCGLASAVFREQGEPSVASP